MESIHKSAICEFTEYLDTIHSDFPEFWERAGLIPPEGYELLNKEVILRFGRFKASSFEGVTLSPEILISLPNKGIETLYLHELAHVIQLSLWPNSEDHGLEWQTICHLLKIREIIYKLDNTESKNLLLLPLFRKKNGVECVRYTF